MASSAPFTTQRILPELSRRLDIKKRWRFVEPEAADRHVQLTRCFECLICQSSCPVFANMADKFVGPLALKKSWTLLWILWTKKEANHEDQ